MGWKPDHWSWFGMPCSTLPSGVYSSKEEYCQLALASSGPRRPNTMTYQWLISWFGTLGPVWSWIWISFEAGDDGKDAIQYLKLDKKQVSK
jgi:hypothetical protein